MSCSDQKWLVDELRTRKRPAEESNIQLSEVLRRSEAFERGDGLLPVRITAIHIMYCSRESNV